MPQSQLGIEPDVYLNGELRLDLRVTDCERSVGIDRLDYAVLERDFGVSGDFLVDLDLKDQWAGSAQFCEVVIAGRPVHYGAISSADIFIGNSLRQTLVSRMEPWHFGTRLKGPTILSRGSSTGDGLAGTPASYTASANAFVLNEDPVFNPMYDGHLVGNRSSLTTSPPLYFFDVRQSRSANAIRYRNENNTVDPAIVAHIDGADLGLTGQYWTLASAVMWLCWALNADQKHVRNPPSLTTLESLLVSATSPATGLSPLLRNVHVRRGGYLPQYLEQLLSPHGYGFFVKHVARGNRELGFYRLGGSASTRKTVSFQRPGETVDMARSNAASIRLAYDVSGRKLINRARVWGAKGIFESTFELIPAWVIDSPERYSNYGQFGKHSDTYKASALIRRMFRDWVLDEGGDYVGNKVPNSALAGGPDFTVREAFDLNAHLQLPRPLFAERRRVFLPTLAQDRSGTPIGEHAGGVLVEYWEPDGARWSNVGLLGVGKDVKLLRDECGIRFDGDFPPQRLHELGRLARVRVTASVEADLAVAGFWNDPSSANPEEVGVDLIQPQKFHYRTIHSRSAFYDGVRGGTLISSERNDSLAIVGEAAHHVHTHNRATCRGTIELEGLNQPGYELGETIDRVVGRNIGLALGPGPARPQIVGIAYRPSAQRVGLTLDEFEELPG